jgi:hypothetical protein
MSQSLLYWNPCEVFFGRGSPSHSSELVHLACSSRKVGSRGAWPEGMSSRKRAGLRLVEVKIESRTLRIGMEDLPRACTRYRATKRTRWMGVEQERDGVGGSVEVLLVTTDG